jgi:hypothetical protein
MLMLMHFLCVDTNHFDLFNFSERNCSTGDKVGPSGSTGTYQVAL